MENYPHNLISKSKTFKSNLSSISEETMVSFNIDKTFSWWNMNNSNYENSIFQIPKNKTFIPMVCRFSENENNQIDNLCDCDIYKFHHDESLHYDENTSFFPDANGQIVHFGTEINEDDFHIQVCYKCEIIQEDNILFQCCRNKHYLCTECFNEEKAKSQRQNVEYERQQRQKQNNISRYEYKCLECDTIEKLKFNIYYNDYYDNLEIIQVYQVI